MTWPEIWEGESLAAGAIRTALTPASWLYELGWRGYLLTYRLGFKKPSRPHRPIICVGNLVAGGSGKTPIVVAIAQRLMEMGKPVVISASGYGSPASEAAQVAPAGDLKASEWGDEPALLRLELPETPLIVGRRRVLAAQLCHDRYPDAVMLMDDGAQHMPLARDLTFLVDLPRQNRRCLPAGPYREPRPRSLTDFRGGKAVLMPEDFQVTYSPLSFWMFDDDRVDPPAEASVLCALGNPASFVKAVQESGVSITSTELRPDHDPMATPDLLKNMPEGPIVVTRKDWVKLRERQDSRDRLFLVARREATITPADKFDDLLREVCQ